MLCNRLHIVSVTSYITDIVFVCDVIVIVYCYTSLILCLCIVSVLSYITDFVILYCECDIKHQKIMFVCNNLFMVKT